MQEIRKQASMKALSSTSSRHIGHLSSEVMAPVVGSVPPASSPGLGSVEVELAIKSPVSDAIVRLPAGDEIHNHVARRARPQHACAQSS